MKKLAVLLVCCAVAPFAVADKYVNGYTKSNGTYVPGYYRSDSNQYKHDNYSSQGNSNPYTGQQGYQPNEYSNPPSYNKSYNSCYGSDCKKDD